MSGGVGPGAGLVGPGGLPVGPGGPVSIALPPIRVNSSGGSSGVVGSVGASGRQSGSVGASNG